MKYERIMKVCFDDAESLSDKEKLHSFFDFSNELSDILLFPLPDGHFSYYSEIYLGFLTRCSRDVHLRCSFLHRENSF